MKVLLLSPYPEKLLPALEAAGDSYLYNDNYADDRLLNPTEIDWVVCFGHRKIIGAEHIGHFTDRIINIHISFLPWNRGADPNFWSWFDDSPKGVSIHRVDEGIDTGNIIVQEYIKSWPESATLRSSYDRLMERACKLFADKWKNIRRDSLATRKAGHDGTYHKKADKDVWFNELSLGWDTPVREIRKLGRNYRASFDPPKKDRSPRPRKYRQQALPEL
jgi:methionyl-tRNA formyltransferase